MQEESRDPAPTRAKVEFPCEQCGADMRWDPECDALACEYCGNRKVVPRREGRILERPLDDAAGAARGLGLEVRVAKCDGCGARVTFEPTATAEVCVYCGSPSVLAQSANRQAIRPESLVPLDISRDQVRQGFDHWLQGLWFRPNALKKIKGLHAVGVYVPFWTFDCEVDSEWSADAGYYYYEERTRTVTVNGRTETRTERVRKTRWVPAWGERSDAYDDLLVNGSTGLPASLVEKLGGFVTEGLVPYEPHYLAGWRAEEYSVDLPEAWEEGKARVVDEQQRRCSRDVPGDTQRYLSVNNRIHGVRWKHVLLPVWSGQYRFRSKTYTVLVNGQTGQVVGEAPYSWIKILALVALVGAIVAVVLAFNS